MFRLARPSDDDLLALAQASAKDDLTYSEVGATRLGRDVEGYRREHYEASLGDGAERLAQAVADLREWQPQRGSGISVAATGPVEVGTVVAMAAPLPIGFALAVCRVVYVEEDDPEHFAFAYGTLPQHPEQGEERFAVSQVNGKVMFEIDVFSKPRHPLARVGAPVARILQRRATNAYLDAMRHPDLRP